MTDGGDTPVDLPSVSGSGDVGAAGLTLADLLQSDRLLPLRTVVQILGDIAVQLDQVHQAGGTYGMLSPSAVELSLDEHARLLPVEDAPAPGPGYLAPERRHGRQGTSSDQYALAIIAWELITGRPRETQLEGTHIAVVTELEVGPSRTLRPGVGPDVNAAIERATNASMQARYPSAGAFVADIASGLDPNATHHVLLKPARQGDPEDAYRSAMINRRASGTALGRIGTWVLGLALAVGVVAGAAWFGGRSPARFWKVDAQNGKQTGFDWFGWKPRVVTSATTPAPGAAAVTGSVNVTVTGATAEVLIDGSVAGRSPVLIPASPGTHTIQVRNGAQRFEPAAVTVRISGRDTVSAVFRTVP